MLQHLLLSNMLSTLLFVVLFPTYPTPNNFRLPFTCRGEFRSMCLYVWQCGGLLCILHMWYVYSWSFYGVQCVSELRSLGESNEFCGSHCWLDCETWLSYRNTLKPPECALCRLCVTSTHSLHLVVSLKTKKIVEVWSHSEASSKHQQQKSWIFQKTKMCVVGFEYLHNIWIAKILWAKTLVNVYSLSFLFLFTCMDSMFFLGSFASIGNNFVCIFW